MISFNGFIYRRKWAKNFRDSESVKNNYILVVNHILRQIIHRLFADSKQFSPAYVLELFG